MIKKIILYVVIFSISAGLIYGGVYRTIARTSTAEKVNQTERNLSLNQGNSGEKNQGQGSNLTGSSNGQQGGKNGSGINRVTADKEIKGIVSFAGVVTQVNEDLLMVLCEDGHEIVVENRAWWFAADAGFSAEVGDLISLNGFYETEEEFEVSYIENLTKGEEIQIREGNGRPLWAGSGRGA